MIHKILFNNSTVYFGKILGENDSFIFAKNFSDDLDLDGYSYINKSKIKSLKNGGRKVKFYQELCRLRGEDERVDVEIRFKSMFELMLSIKSTTAIDYVNKYGENIFFVGFVEVVKKKYIGGRYISPLGGVNELSLDMIRYDEIIRVQIGGRYLKAFDLYTAR